jgi:hypothetical protein
MHCAQARLAFVAGVNAGVAKIAIATQERDPSVAGGPIIDQTVRLTSSPAFSPRCDRSAAAGVRRR